MRKHGIDLEDTTRGDGSRPKRLDRKDLDALMGDGRGGIFTWREKNRRRYNLRLRVTSERHSRSQDSLIKDPGRLALSKAFTVTQGLIKLIKRARSQ
jgi:hypothetical protein